MGTVGFDAFWSAWPSNAGLYSRKGAKAECLKRWKARHHESQAGQIVKHIEWMKTTADWLKDRGAFIPAPLVYLNQQRWDGADVPDSPDSDADPASRTAAYLASQRQSPEEKAASDLARRSVMARLGART